VTYGSPAYFPCRDGLTSANLSSRHNLRTMIFPLYLLCTAILITSQPSDLRYASFRVSRFSNLSVLCHPESISKAIFRSMWAKSMFQRPAGWLRTSSTPCDLNCSRKRSSIDDTGWTRWRALAMFSYQRSVLSDCGRMECPSRRNRALTVETEQPTFSATSAALSPEEYSSNISSVDVGRRFM
jgi:hypothetical protein